jgi:hypothetical protein
MLRVQKICIICKICAICMICTISHAHFAWQEHARRQLRSSNQCNFNQQEQASPMLKQTYCSVAPLHFYSFHMFFYFTVSICLKFAHSFNVIPYPSHDDSTECLVSPKQRYCMYYCHNLLRHLVCGQV